LDYDVTGDLPRFDVDTLDVRIASSEAVELDDLETFIVAFATDEHGDDFALAFEVARRRGA